MLPCCLLDVLRVVDSIVALPAWQHLVTLATALRDSAAALIGGDLELAERALSEARRIDTSVAQLREELDGG